MKMSITKIISALCLVSTLSFATAYDDQNVETWTEDGFETMNTINGVLKIMGFTQANSTTFINQGDYKISFKDPFNSGDTIMNMYVNSTQADSSSPLIVKCAMGPGENTHINSSAVRYVHVTINKGVQDGYPLGDFTLETYAFDPTSYTFSDMNSSIYHEKMKLVVSANNGDVTIQMSDIGHMSWSDYNKWVNLEIDGISGSRFTSGKGTMSSSTNYDGSSPASTYIAFDTRYIADRNSSNGGNLYHKNEYDTVNYTYKAFNQDGSNLSLGSDKISSFSYQDPNGGYGYLSSNYEGNTSNDGSTLWSGIYYTDTNDSTYTVGMTITDQSSNTEYIISDFNTTTNFIDINTTSGDKRYIAPWYDINGSNQFYISGDKIYPAWGGDGPSVSNLTDGSTLDVDTADVNQTVMVKAIQKKQSIATVGSEAVYTDLSDLNATYATEIDALESKMTTNLLTDPGLTFTDTTNMDTVKTWFDAISDKSAVQVKVIDGVIQ